MSQATHRILLAESRGFSLAAREILGRAGRVIEADLDRAGLLGKVPGVDVLWVRLRHLIDEEVFRAGSGLRLVVTNTTGLNHIDLAAAQRHHVRVLSLRGEAEFLKSVRGTAELTLGLILALTRRIPAASRQVENGSWDRYRFKGHDLHGRTAGVIGYGRLGRIVAGYLRGLGMRLLVRTLPEQPLHDAAEVEQVSLDVLLSQADLVTLHANLTDANRHMMGPAQFAALKTGAWFINTARGELVDEEALLAALQSGRVGGGALDVLDGEYKPLINQRLVRYACKHDNLIITPHIGGYTHESLERTELFLAARVLEALQVR